MTHGRQNSVVIIVTSLWPRQSGVQLLAWTRSFPHPQKVQTGSGAHTAFCYGVLGDLSLGVKRPGLEVDHSSPSTAEVMNEWRYTSNHPTCLHGVDGDNFTFIYTMLHRCFI